MARAAALSPDARRASIVDATLPLLRVHGRAVTTAQIAMAAGVAEGTLFRVFPDKDALIGAAIAKAFDSAESIAELGRIDRTAPLRDQLIVAAEILQRRIGQIWQLISILGLSPPVHDRGGPPPDEQQLRAALTDLFMYHRDEIRLPPEHAARMLRALAFAGTHPRLIDQPLTPHEVVSLLLDGIRARDED